MLYECDHQEGKSHATIQFYSSVLWYHFESLHQKMKFRPMAFIHIQWHDNTDCLLDNIFSSWYLHFEKTILDMHASWMGT